MAHLSQVIKTANYFIIKRKYKSSFTEAKKTHNREKAKDCLR